MRNKINKIRLILGILMPIIFASVFCFDSKAESTFIYKAREVVYNEAGDAAYCYKIKNLYQDVFVEKDLSRLKLNECFTTQAYDGATKEYKRVTMIIVPYGTESISDKLPASNKKYNGTTGKIEEYPITWSAVPEGGFNHVEGYDFVLTGNSEVGALNVIVCVLPSETLNVKRPAEGMVFTAQGDKYTNGTLTGEFRTYSNLKYFVLTDGSKLSSGIVNIGGANYSLDENGACYFNEYRGGYFYGEDGRRVEGITYQWGKEDDNDIYYDSNGNRLTLAYALIDGNITFFDGRGYAWQTFGYPSYVLDSNSVLVGVPAKFDNTSKEEIIKRITEIREDAVKCGIIEKYEVPKWSYAQERGSMVRACEAALFADLAHKRPAQKAADLKFEGISHCGENCLAWGGGGSLESIEMYYSEKESLINKDGGVTGHYTALLYGEYIGTASASLTSLEIEDDDYNDSSYFGDANAYGYHSSKYSNIKEDKIQFAPYSIQIIEIDKSRLKVVKDQSVVSKVRGAQIYTYNLDGIRKVSCEGKIVSKNGKKAFQYYDGTYAKNKWIWTNRELYYCSGDGEATKYVNGMKYSQGGIEYRIHDLKYNKSDIEGGWAEAYQLTGKNYSVDVSGELNLGGEELEVKTVSPNFAKGNKMITYLCVDNNVTQIGKNAFSGCKHLKTVDLGKNLQNIGSGAFSKCINLKKITIPENVNKIEKNAFNGCKSLKKITIKTKKLTKKNVGKNAFKGIHKKAVIKVPKAKKKAYKKFLKKKGLPKKAKIK